MAPISFDVIMLRRLLVADDDPLMRTLISVSFGIADRIAVVEAADGDEAMAHFERTCFDVAILDWQMPGKSGLDIVRAIRAEGNPTPILMVTAEARKGPVTEAVNAGVSDYLIKPFDVLVLRGRVERLLGEALFPPERNPRDQTESAVSFRVWP